MIYILIMTKWKFNKPFGIKIRVNYKAKITKNYMNRFKIQNLVINITHISNLSYL
jgi:hypothetical protein